MTTLKEYSRLRGGVLSASLLAWTLLLVARDPDVYCSPAIAGTSWDLLRTADLSAMAKGWSLMFVAMMGPMLIAPLHFVYVSSLARTRVRLMTLCAIGYTTVWAGAAIVLSVGELAAEARYPGAWWPALVTGALALTWQASPWKKACLNRCHRHRPIAAFGTRAQGDAFRVGWEHGLWCVGSCWLNMLWPMLLPAGHIAGMMAVGLLMFCERLDPGAVPVWQMRGFRTAIFYLGWVWRRAQSRPLAATS